MLKVEKAGKLTCRDSNRKNMAVQDLRRAGRIRVSVERVVKGKGAPH